VKTECTPKQLEFESVGQRNLVATFDADSISMESQFSLPESSFFFLYWRPVGLSALTTPSLSTPIRRTSGMDCSRSSLKVDSSVLLLKEEKMAIGHGNRTRQGRLSALVTGFESRHPGPRDARRD